MLNPETGFGRTFSIVTKSESVPRRHQVTVNILVSTFHGMGWAKKFVRVFHQLLWQNPNELFGHPYTLPLHHFMHFLVGYVRPILVAEPSVTQGPDGNLP